MLDHKSMKAETNLNLDMSTIIWDTVSASERTEVVFPF